jgi:hypothetical protein
MSSAGGRANPGPGGAPAGRLRLVPRPGTGARACRGEAIPFTGWLSLLRALSEVVGPADGEHLDRG